MLAILRGIYGINFVGRRVGGSTINPCHFSAQILIRGPHAVVIFDCTGSKLAEEPPDLTDFTQRRALITEVSDYNLIDILRLACKGSAFIADLLAGSQLLSNYH